MGRQPLAAAQLRALESRIPGWRRGLKLSAAGTNLSASEAPASDETASKKALYLDLAGATLVVGSTTWTIIAGLAHGRESGPGVILVLACACAIVFARLVGSRMRPIVPGLVIVSALALLVRAPSDVLGRSPLGGPFAYANATGAFYVQAALAGLMLAASTRVLGFRIAGWGAALGFAMIPFAVDVRIAAGLIIVLPLVGIGAFLWRGPRGSVALLSLLFVTTLATTLVLGSAEMGSGSASVAGSETDRRLVLWGDAFDLLLHRPITGVGPGGFAEVSPTAQEDVDARWAHHEFLQQGAETGLPGMTLMVALFCWGFVRLYFTPRADAVTVLGAVALSALGIHASADYILHFPAVPIVAAALVGTAQVTPGVGPLGNEAT